MQEGEEQEEKGEKKEKKLSSAAFSWVLNSDFR